MTDPCKYFIAKTFAHMAGGLAITTLSASHPILYNAISTRINPILLIIIWLIVLLLVFYVLQHMPANTALKYIVAIIAFLLVGQLSGNSFTRLESEDLLYRVFFLTTAVFVALVCVGLYDNQNYLSLQPYLFAVLIGLILAEIVLYLIELFRPFQKKTFLRINTIFSFIFVGIFSLYAVVNMQVLKDNASRCKTNPDFINESLSLFFTYINLFQNIGNIQ
jgi:FtsH-binding integral membrane protein